MFLIHRFLFRNPVAENITNLILASGLVKSGQSIKHVQCVVDVSKPIIHKYTKQNRKKLWPSRIAEVEGNAGKVKWFAGKNVLKRV